MGGWVWVDVCVEKWMWGNGWMNGEIYPYAYALTHSYTRSLLTHTHTSTPVLDVNVTRH